MLDFLREWALSLSGVAVFGSLCEVILPEGSFQKYIRLSVGLLLVLTLMTPFRQLFHLVPSWEEIAPKEQAYTEQETMEQQERAAVLLVYRENLNRKFLSSIKERLGENPIGVQCRVEEENPKEFGTVRQVQVTLADTGTDRTQAVKDALKEDWGISEKQVQVRYLKERNG